MLQPKAVSRWRTCEMQVRCSRHSSVCPCCVLTGFPAVPHAFPQPIRVDGETDGGVTSLLFIGGVPPGGVANAEVIAQTNHPFEQVRWSLTVRHSGFYGNSLQTSSDMARMLIEHLYTGHMNLLQYSLAPARATAGMLHFVRPKPFDLSLIHISEPTRRS